MSLTKKIGSYLCTAAMVFNLNVKSDALVKEILQVPGIVVEFVVGAILLCDGAKSKTEQNIDIDKNNINKFKDNMPNNNGPKLDAKGVKGMKSVGEAAFGLFSLFDAVQRTCFLVFGDGNSKTEKTDNKKVNKKNEKKVENA